MVSDAQLKEAEEIGKGLEPQKPKISHDADDLFILKQLIETQPDLVPRTPFDYYDIYEKYITKKEGYTSLLKAAESAGLKSKGSLHYPFETIKKAISDTRGGIAIGPVTELPALDSERLIEIYKKGKMVQLDPRKLLPPEGHKHYELSRYFQKRRGPRQHSIEVLAASIGKNGMYEPPTIQDAGSHNGFIQRPDDGFSRLLAWIMADEAAGGTNKVPVLEYPVCLLVDCTNAEGELIALEKNKNKDNYDIGDRDYSILTMHERHPEIYTNKALAELNNLSPSTVSSLISAWQESWPCDKEKGETKQNNPIRKALESRQITTYHGRALARLSKWPVEQKRVADWLLQQVEYSRQRDAYYRSYWENERSNEDEGVVIRKFDTHGLSAGTLMKSVRQAEQKMKDITDVASKVKKMLKDGTIGQKVHEEDLWDLQKKISSSITKDAFTKGLRAAGVSITTVKPKAKDVKPSSPASPPKDASSQTTILTAKTVGLEPEPEPEPEPIKVCTHCQFALTPNIRGEEVTCQIGQEPNEKNECPVQFFVPGKPSSNRMQCVHCGGFTFPQFIESFDAETELEYSKNGQYFMAHTVCLHDIRIKELDIKGSCHSCARNECELLDAVQEGKLDVEVKHCPAEEWVTPSSRTNLWFTPRPEKSIKEINKEVKKQLEHFVKQCSEDFEKSKDTTVVAAGRSD